MTVQTSTSRVSYTGSGTTGPFSIPFYFLANADIVAKKVLIADGTETSLVLTTDYTLTGAGDSDGGTLTLVATLSSSYRLVIYRDPAILQENRYPRNDPFPAETHEETVDRLTMISQRTRNLVDRSLRQPDGDTTAIGELPPKVERAGGFLAFDSLTGDPIISSGGVTGVAVESVVQIVGTIAALKALDIPTAAITVLVLGYYSALDVDGGGYFYWNGASSATDNGGTIIRPDSAPATGRWVRKHNGTCTAAQFGATINDTTGSTNRTAINNLLQTADVVRCVFSDNYTVNGTIRHNGKYLVGTRGFRSGGGINFKLSLTAGTYNLFAPNDDGYGVHLEGVRFTIDAASTFTGSVIVNVLDIHYRYNYLDRVYQAGFSSYGDNVFFTGIRFSADSLSHAIYNQWVTNCVFGNNDYDILVDGSAASGFDRYGIGFHIWGNQCASTSSAAKNGSNVKINNGFNIELFDNQFNGTGAADGCRAVWITGASAHCVLRDNYYDGKENGKERVTLADTTEKCIVDEHDIGSKEIVLTTSGYNEVYDHRMIVGTDPTLANTSGGTTHTYGTCSLTYRRDGAMMEVWGRVNVSSKDGTIAGDARIGGLPKACSLPSGDDANIPVFVGYVDNAANSTNYTAIQGAIYNGGTEIRLLESSTSTSGNAAFLPVSKLGSQPGFTFNFRYPVK